MNKTTVKSLMAVLMLTGATWAYNEKEITFISWGDADNQLHISDPVFVEGDEPGAGSLSPWGGPTQGFVDAEERIYFSCYDPGYFKAFDRAGNLVTYIRPDSSDNGATIFIESVNAFYVDSLFRVYIESFPQMKYITVLTLDGRVIDRLNPFGPDSGVNIDGLDYHSLDVLTFDCWYRGYYTYIGGQFEEGGGFSWRAGDGFYYFINYFDSTSMTFIKYLNPNLRGSPEWRDSTIVPYDGNLKSAGLLAVDDSMNFYVRFVDQEPLRDGIQVYNDEYELIDEIIMATYENKYRWYMKNFVRRDGNIYEFRCLDDGVHVIKWTKE